jgi:endonuclease/exonuclease/phosphatase family metal-dependent hydrolase
MKKRTSFRPFRALRILLGRAGMVVLSTGFVLLLSFLFIRFTEKTRAISVQGPEIESAPPARAPESLRVVTYNLSHGLGPGGMRSGVSRSDPAEVRSRLERVGAHFGTLGLDLIALQAVDFDSRRSGGFDQAAVVADAAGFPYVVRQRNVDTGIPFFRREVHGNALLSRFPVVETERVEFAPLRNLEKVRSGNPDGLLAVVRIGEDQDIRVLVTQLDSRSEEVRVRAAGEIVSIQRSSRLPMLVMGTLHSTPPGFPMSETTSSGQNAVELLESFGGFQRRPARGQATWHDFTHPSSGPRRIVDWIFPDRSWSVQQYQVLRDVKESDHFPLMGTFRLR